MTDTPQDTATRETIENATWDLRQAARQNAWVGFWIASSNLLIGILAWFGIDLLDQGLTDPLEKALTLGFTAVYAAIVAGAAIAAWNGSRIGTVGVFAFAAFEVIAVLITVLTGGRFALPILPAILTYFAGRGMLASFKYHTERKRLVDEAVFS